jgi:hypothetical protein
MVDVKGPTEATEAAYIHSVVLATAQLRRSLARFTPPSATQPAGANLAARPTTTGEADQALADPLHPLPNVDLDTGRVVMPGGYSLTDATYAQLLHTLTRQPNLPIPPGIKRDIQAFYANLEAPITTRKDPQKWAQVQADLATLGPMPTSPEPPPYQTYGDDSNRPSQKTGQSE